MKSFFILVIFLAFQVFAENSFVIEERNSNSIVLSITIDSIIEKKVIDEGNEYTCISVNNFGQLGNVGAPRLPYRAVKILTSENPNIKIEILSSEVETKNSYSLYPEQEPLWAAIGMEQITQFQMDNTIYQKSEFYPKDPVTSQGTMTHYGVPVTSISISPISYNPVSKEIKIFKKLRVRILFNEVPSRYVSRINTNSSIALENSVVNFNKNNLSRRFINEDFTDDILILTVPAYKAAAEELAVWQRMKGYDVKIDSRNSWSVSSAETAAHNFYNNTDPKPGYLILLGDSRDIPGKSVSSSYESYHTDLYYTCTGGEGDYVPDYSSGRISVSSSQEAVNVINKIVNYEKNPPLDSSFYNSVLGTALFQDLGPNGIADRAFAENVELALKYLIDDHEKNGIREYARTHNQYQNVLPKQWGSTYGAGGMVPSYLSGQWDGDAAGITEAINNGTSLVFHSDHGAVYGWGDPKFYKADLVNLTNGNLQPVVYSMDCHVGTYTKDCFAEVMFRKKDAGTVGIIAASTFSYSGYNDAQMLGMIDASWPSNKLTYKTPSFPNPTVTTHQPIYTMGNVHLQGLFRMTETWRPGDGVIDHYRMYHFFGDPSMKMWVKYPEPITENSPNNNVISSNAGSFNFTGLSIDSGFVTLYNTNKKEIVSKSSVANGAANLIFQNKPGETGDTLIMTVTSDHHRPFLKTFIIDVVTGVNLKNIVLSNKMSIKGSTLYLSKSMLETGSIKIYDLKGKTVKSIKLKSGRSEFTSNLQKQNLPNGIYHLNMEIKNFSKVIKTNHINGL